MPGPSVASATPSATLRPFFLEVKLKSGEGLINIDEALAGSLVGLLLARPDAAPGNDGLPPTQPPTRHTPAANV